ncbi:MAG: pilin [Firmicutes bacterium]|nr:pilin [Bacillota bacterium]
MRHNWWRAGGLWARRWGPAILGLAALAAPGLGGPLAFAAAAPHHVLLASGSGVNPVNYSTANTALGDKVTNAMESIASTIRYLLGGTALVVILAAAIMNHFVHDPRAKERAKELIGAAVVGLLLAAFAPAIVNFIANL